ncbi:hypothetical protein SAY87_007143 [Trapa incisa]|uniref:Acyl-[acyl-carrier-protein] hydrolase n=1 Tax=Trapa incisa TaxID=236973 RepID=A0AAN7JZS5_9MYRT|nr:hypothetical protein SAY87_007143 [Trapa incisa]
MAASAATSAFFPVPSPDYPAKPTKHGNDSVNLGSMKSKSASGALQVKENAQAPPKINGSSVGLAKIPETAKADDNAPSPPPRTFINQLPDWSMLLAAITTVFLAAEKQWMMLDWKPRRSDMLIDPFDLGRIVQDGLVFRQNFSIRSYEIGADRTASIETLMNHLQETALNHVKTVGLLGEGFGSTPEMTKRNLIWVVTKMQVLVNRYPTWGDVVQVDTWVCGSGKNGMRRDWLVRDINTGETLIRASSVWVMMNKLTRKLSKIPEEARGEIEPYFMNSPPVVDEDSRKLPKLDDSCADHVLAGLTPKWSDLDVNQHVNNVKYVGWILESAPQQLLETHELCAITLEYKRECGKDSVLQSLTKIAGEEGNDEAEKTHGMECEHSLRIDTGPEILRARTGWRPKEKNGDGAMGEFSAENA